MAYTDSSSGDHHSFYPNFIQDGHIHQGKEQAAG
jgi:hypothetical protein